MAKRDETVVCFLGELEQTNQDTFSPVSIVAPCGGRVNRLNYRTGRVAIPLLENGDVIWMSRFPAGNCEGS